MSKIETQGAWSRDTNGAPPSFQAPSLLLMRQFLFEQGMMIVPWGSTGDVLDELHLLLQTHSRDDAFWQSLRRLLQALNLDLQRLLPKQGRANEVPSLAAREALLDELRSCLNTEATVSTGFAGLLRRVSQSCLSVLLLLAGAAAVSCGARAEDDHQAGTKAAGGVNTTGGVSAVGGNSTRASGGTLGGFSIVTLPATGGNATVNPAGTVPCVKNWDAGGPLSMTDLQSITNQCIATSDLRDDVLACLATLNTSWERSIESLLNCSDCDEAVDTLTRLMNSCSGLPEDYNRCVLDPWFCMGIYDGVRFA